MKLKTLNEIWSQVQQDGTFFNDTPEEREAYSAMLEVIPALKDASKPAEEAATAWAAECTKNGFMCGFRYASLIWADVISGGKNPMMDKGKEDTNQRDGKESN